MQTYENAASGLKKMFIAEIGAIICAVVAIIPILGIIGVLGSLVFLVISLIGLNNAGKDIEGCKNAFTLTIVQLIVSVIAGLFGSGVLGTILTIVNDIFALLIVRAVCMSVAEVMDMQRQPEIAGKGRTVWKINLVCYVIAIILSVISLIPLLGFAIAAIGSLITGILSLIASIMYMIFLNNSYKALSV